MKRAIITAFVCLLCLLLFSGCSRTTTQSYLEKKRNEVRASVVVDSAFFSRYLADLRNTTTTRTDSVIVHDSVVIRELADGSKETYRERNTERVGNYVQVDQMQKVLQDMEKRISSQRDTMRIEEHDTTYIYKVREPGKVQRAFNYMGTIITIIGFCWVLWLIFLRFRRK